LELVEISLVLNLGFGKFEFVSDFVLRISNLEKAIKKIILTLQTVTSLKDLTPAIGGW
jgi:hypothetical protein